MGPQFDKKRPPVIRWLVIQAYEYVLSNNGQIGHNVGPT